MNSHNCDIETVDIQDIIEFDRNFSIEDYDTYAEAVSAYWYGAIIELDGVYTWLDSPNSRLELQDTISSFRKKLDDFYEGCHRRLREIRESAEYKFEERLIREIRGYEKSFESLLKRIIRKDYFVSRIEEVIITPLERNLPEINRLCTPHIREDVKLFLEYVKKAGEIFEKRKSRKN